MRDVQAAATIKSVCIVRDDERACEGFLEDLYDTYARSLFRYAYAITRSAEDAEDVLQEVFAKIARERRRLISPEAIKAYLFTAVRNSSYSILRTKHRRDRFTDEWANEAKWIDDDAADAVIQSHVMRSAFAGLPPEQREVLVLKVYEEMSFKEIAEAVGSSINTVASRYRYAIAKLREILQGDTHER